MNRKFNTLVILAIAGVLVSSITFGQSWTMQNVGFQQNGSDPFKVSIVDANIAWTIGDYQLLSIPDQEFSRTLDGGNTWMPGMINSDPSFANMSVAAVDANNAYVAQINQVTNSGGYIYHTTDGGNNWSRVGEGQIFTAQNSFVTSIYFWNAVDGIVMGDPVNGVFEIYRTTDAGNTWTAVPSANIPVAMPSEWLFPKSYDIVDSTIWFGTNQGRVFKSSDRGLHWSATTLGEPGYTLVAFLDDKMTGFGEILSSATSYFNTYDGGETWTAFTPTGPAYPFIQAIPGTNYLVSAGSVLNGMEGSSYSSNLGHNWTTIDTAGRGTTDGYFWITFHDIYTGYASGFTQSPTVGGIYKWNPEILGISKHTAESGLHVYPNPASDKVWVTGVAPGTILDLYDSEGRALESITTNSDKTVMNISTLTKGLYFLKTEDRTAKIQKM